MTDLILPFSSPDATLANVGGKGANLAELVRGGFAECVPPGFLVTTEAYRAFVAANEIRARLLELADQATPDDPETLEAASAEIRAMFAQGQLPPGIAEQIVAAYHLLNSHTPTPPHPPVAVRSSATAEDLPGLSFAGQQDTYLNVVGADAVMDAVKNCWGSLWTARALGYRARNRIPPEDVALAVVVQTMIPSDSSGVLFTANPLTGHRGEIVIDASFGLGEAIVAGQVEPDHFVVSLPEGRIVRRKLGAKALAILPRPGGGVEPVKQSADSAERQALPDAQVLELARLGQRVAAHFGSPQDIEWAWADGRLHLLQSRPITSLYPLPDLPAPDGLRVYFCFNSLQGLPDPITPLGQDALQMLLGGGLRFLRIQAPPREALPVAGGRLFMNATPLAQDPRLRKVLLGFLANADPGAHQSLLRLLAEGRITTRRVLTPRRMLSFLGVLRRVAPRGLGAMRAPERARARATAELDAFLAHARRRVLQAGDLSARLDVMEELVGQIFSKVFMRMMPAAGPGLAAMGKVDDWLVRWLDLPPGSALHLTRGLPGNVTTEMDLKLWATAQIIRADPAAREAMLTRPVPELAEAYRRGALPPVAQHALHGFLAEYGMRAVAEVDMGRERWRDEPSSILQTVRSYLELEDPSLAPDLVFRRGAAEAERLAAERAAQLRRLPWGALRARLFRGAVRRMRELSGLREAPKFYAIQIFDLCRTALLDSAGELAARGELERAEDIFFVPFETLRQFARGEPKDLRALAAASRAEFERERARRQLPRLLLSTGEAFYEGVSGTDESTDTLVGDPVSPGVVEGRVRVVLDPRGVRLEPGEVLVCPATDPGWTPLFLAASGLVMEMGGLITHGSVVAREYGLPAVVGVHQATTRLKTGQRVRVDGNLGRVTVLDP